MPIKGSLRLTFMHGIDLESCNVLMVEYHGYCTTVRKCITRVSFSFQQRPAIAIVAWQLITLFFFTSSRQQEPSYLIVFPGAVK